jgi:iron complex transport system substrate-binding protein
VPRVVSLIASSTEIVCALGCGEWLVGRSHECDHPAWVRGLPQLTKPRFPTSGDSRAIDTEVRALVSQGLSPYEVDTPGLEALSPDVILTQVQCEVCAPSLRDVEEALRHSIRSRPQIVSLHSERLADVWRDIRRVSDALGVPERGVQLITRLQRRMAAVAERASQMGTRPRVAFLEWLDPLMAGGHWMPELIAMAGGVDCFGTAGGATTTIDWETLRAADPDALWVAPCGFDLARTARECGMLTSRPGFSELAAARGERVHLGDGNALFNRPGPRLAETLEAMAEALHPAAFRFGHRGTSWERLASLVRT